MNAQLDHPMAYKIDSTRRAIYRCVRDYGPLRTIRGIIPRIVDFGASVRFDDVEDRPIHPIQPDHYRAPEVILGGGMGDERQYMEPGYSGATPSLEIHLV